MNRIDNAAVDGHPTSISPASPFCPEYVPAHVLPLAFIIPTTVSVTIISLRRTSEIIADASSVKQQLILASGNWRGDVPFPR